MDVTVFSPVTYPADPAGACERELPRGMGGQPGFTGMAEQHGYKQPSWQSAVAYPHCSRSAPTDKQKSVSNPRLLLDVEDVYECATCMTWAFTYITGR